MGGIRYVTGEPDRPPVQTGISLGDALASLYAVIAALMAVHARDARGRSEGQVVDVALYEAVFNLMESMIREYDVAGIVRERTGAALPRIAPSNSYCTGDGSYVAVGAKSDAIFKRLVKAIGRPELGDDPRYETNADRTEHAEELDELIEDWTRWHTSDEVLHILEEVDVPVGPIYSVTDIVEDPQYQAREMFLDAEIDGIGPVKTPGLVPKLSETPSEVKWYGGSSGSTTTRSTAGSSASRPRNSSGSPRKGDRAPTRRDQHSGLRHDSRTIPVPTTRITATVAATMRTRSTSGISSCQPRTGKAGGCLIPTRALKRRVEEVEHRWIARVHAKGHSPPHKNPPKVARNDEERIMHEARERRETVQSMFSTV
jgi:hypothetical protein